MGYAEGLPEGCGLVLRTFGRSDIQAQAFDLSALSRERGLTLLIAAEPELALRTGAAGVHWPQARLSDAARWRRRFAIMSASVHDPMALRRGGRLCDLLFVSPAFNSSSPSAGRRLGAFRVAAYARSSRTPVYALGGVTGVTAPRLKNLGISGLAAIDGLKAPSA